MNKKICGIILDKQLGIIVLNSHINIYDVSKALSSNFDKNFYLICGIWWSIESPKQFLKTIFILVRNRILFGKIKVTIMCNTHKEYTLLRLLRFNAIYCNQNCFVDERIFDIKEYIPQKYNAIYNAVLRNFKRHDLCSEIDNLALITYNFENSEYKDKLDSTLKNHVWLNYEKKTEPVFFDNSELCNYYNQSKVGLALSQIEGAMYVSNEYLLCGLPVLTTKSKGGRDVFYDTHNSLIVEDSPDAIKKGLEKLLSSKIQREEIRKNTIKLMNKHRDTFIEYVNEIYKKNNININIRDTWESWFINKLRHDLSIEKIINNLKE